jgi:phosphinothricin acetyltransferase
MRESFDEVRGLTLDHVPGDVVQGAIVDRLFDAVAAAGRLQIRLDLDVHGEWLRLLALRVTDAVTTTEYEAFEPDTVHPVIVAPSFPRLRRVGLREGAPRTKPGAVGIRAAGAIDLPAINDIYNEYVVAAHYTFDLEPMSLDLRREWFGHYGTEGRHRVLVAVRDGRVVGFTTSSRFRVKPAYETSVETSIYLAPEVTGGGLGTRLYAELFRGLEGEDVHRAYAGVALPNPASVALHERFGFKKVAHFTEQGRKFGRYWDVAWFEKPLGEA